MYIYIYKYIYTYIYIYNYIRQKTPDFTLHCVTCLIDNLSDVIFIFSNNFLKIQNT